MSRSSLAGAAALVTALSLGQKLVAFVREQAIARAFGATGAVDAYFLGMAVPELGWIVAASGLTGAMVPALAGLIGKDERMAARQTAASAMRWAVLFAALFAGAAYLALPAVLSLIAADWPSERIALAVACGRLALPAVVAAAAAAPLRALLHANQIFLYTPLAVLIQNLLVATLALTLFGIGPRVLAAGQLVGITLHLAIFGFVLYRIGQVPAGGAWQPGELRSGLGMLVPLTVWALSVQSYALLDRFLGSMSPEGSVAALAYADKLRQLPLQTAMYAVAMVAYPALAAAAATGDRPRLQAVMGQGLRLVAMVALPVMVGLAVLSRPIVEVVYQRGAFGAEATAVTAAVVAIAGLAVLPLGLGSLLAYTNFSLGRPWRPVAALVAGEGLHLAGGLVLGRSWGATGIATAALGGAMLAATLQAWLLWDVLGGQARGLVRQTGLPLLATLVMGLLCAVALPVLDSLSPALRGGATLVVVAAATVVYAGVLWFGGVPEVRAAATAVQSRLLGVRHPK